MTALDFRPASECRFDLVSLGEVMLRLDPGPGRIHTTRSFQAWEGGGEYNVARGLRRCFGLRTAVVTALADNPVGRLIEDLMLQGGVDLSYLKWMPYDGVGRGARNGLNFTERGFGPRGAVGCYDRGNSAASCLRPEDVDWERLFREGARVLHTGACSRRSRRRRPTWCAPRWSLPESTGRASRTISTTASPCGAPSAAKRGRAR